MVGEVTEQDTAGPRGRALRLGELVGKDGLERSYDDTLRGQDGEKFVEVSALGYVVREGAAPDLLPVAGASLQTTLDLDLQRYVSRVFPPGEIKTTTTRPSGRSHMRACSSTVFASGGETTIPRPFETSASTCPARSVISAALLAPPISR